MILVSTAITAHARAMAFVQVLMMVFVVNVHQAFQERLVISVSCVSKRETYLSKSFLREYRI